jgi:Transposase
VKAPGPHTLNISRRVGPTPSTRSQVQCEEPVLDAFHVVRLGFAAVDDVRRRIQREQTGHRGRTGDPLYGIRRVLRTGSDLLTDRQRQRLTAVFATGQHVEVASSPPTATTTEPQRRPN